MMKKLLMLAMCASYALSAETVKDKNVDIAHFNKIRDRKVCGVAKLKSDQTFVGYSMCKVFIKAGTTIENVGSRISFYPIASSNNNNFKEAITGDAAFNKLMHDGWTDNDGWVPIHQEVITFKHDMLAIMHSSRGNIVEIEVKSGNFPIISVGEYFADEG